ncbi:MAG: tetratricopeptide repeat protein [Phycisphaerales bacterium]|nr:tetratricopeptide repeat protein [Phycisphaerales bacterium]
MSYLLEILGRGLIAHMSGAFSGELGVAPEESLEALEQAAEQNPDDIPTLIRLGGQYLRHQEPVAARQVFLDILAEDKNNYAARLGLACVFDELNQIDVALEQLRIAQKTEPANPAILFCLGHCQERLGREEPAMDYYRDSLSLCPTLRNAHERLAAIYLKNDETDLAIHHYIKLCDLDPHQTDLHITLASLLLKSGDCEGAIQRYEHALSLDPENWTAHNDIVSAYEEAGLIREAIEHLHKMIDSEADFADTRLRLGDLYARLGDDVSAMTHYHRALEICPDYLEANVKLGTQHLRAGRYSDAARSFSSSLEINDRLLSAYVGIGVAQHAKGCTDQAMASFDMARNIEPNSTLLFSEVARMQLKAAASAESDSYLMGSEKTGTLEDSTPATDLISRQIQRLRQSIKSNPNHADLHYRLGLLLKNRGQIEDAIEAFRQAVQINPCYMKALIKLGLALKEVDQTEEAVEVFKQATEIQPEYVDLHYQLGLLFIQRYQFEIAVEHFEYAVQGNPENIGFQANLALALQNMGLIDRANASWQIVCDLAPESAEAAQARVAMAKNRESK